MKRLAFEKTIDHPPVTKTFQSAVAQTFQSGVTQAFLPAVAQTFQSAVTQAFLPAYFTHRWYADWKVGGTADSKVCATLSS